MDEHKKIPEESSEGGEVNGSITIDGKTTEFHDFLILLTNGNMQVRGGKMQIVHSTIALIDYVLSKLEKEEDGLSIRILISYFSTHVESMAKGKILEKFEKHLKGDDKEVSEKDLKNIDIDDFLDRMNKRKKEGGKDE